MLLFYLHGSKKNDKYKNLYDNTLFDVTCAQCLPFAQSPSACLATQGYQSLGFSHLLTLPLIQTIAILLIQILLMQALSLLMLHIYATLPIRFLRHML